MQCLTALEHAAEQHLLQVATPHEAIHICHCIEEDYNAGTELWRQAASTSRTRICHETVSDSDMAASNHFA